MRAETDETAQNAKAALNHAEDRLKELNDRKKEVDKLQKKLTRRLDAVEALMAGNVKEAVEEFV
jgi:predicted translin family RNA/ssDNA-binding protein